MEVLITLYVKTWKKHKITVAILVLVEVLITLDNIKIYSYEKISRNPCFSGSSNHTRQMVLNMLLKEGRNPCFSGSSNHTP